MNVVCALQKWPFMALLLLIDFPFERCPEVLSSKLPSYKLKLSTDFQWCASHAASCELPNKQFFSIFTFYLYERNEKQNCHARYVSLSVSFNHNEA